MSTSTNEGGEGGSAYFASFSHTNKAEVVWQDISIMMEENKSAQEVVNPFLL